MKWFIGVMVAGLILALSATSPESSALSTRADIASSNLAANEFGFTRLPLGYRVSSWFPVDIDDDGIWELAITIAGTPTRVGVFAPRVLRWIDGPWAIPVTGTNWGVTDFDSDGHLEYSYLSGQSVRSFDSKEQSDMLLFTVDFIPMKAVFWGQSPEGTPLVGILKNTSVTHEFSDSLFQGRDSYFNYTWNLYSLADGSLKTSLPGGLGAVRRLDTRAYIGEDQLIFLVCAGESHYVQMGGSQGSYYEGLRVVNGSWSYSFTRGLPGIGTSEPFSISIWGLGNAAVVFDSSVGTPEYIGHSYPMGNGVDAGQYLGAGGVTSWGVNSSPCHLCPPQGSWYAGIAAYDINLDGKTELLLPLFAASAWEVRDPITGVVLDTLANMPSVDLRNGRLFDLSHRELFYVADSALYIYHSDVYSGIGDDTDQGQAQAKTPTLSVTAFPNPFNAAVTLSWPPGVDARSLTIYNILGQEVRSYRLSESRGEMSWDGRDMQGRGAASGVYFGRLVNRDAATTVKLVLLR